MKEKVLPLPVRDSHGRVLKKTIPLEKVVYGNNSYSSVFWFKEDGKFFRIRGKRVFRCGKTLIEYSKREESLFVANTPSKALRAARELGIPIVHTRRIYGRG